MQLQGFVGFWMPICIFLLVKSVFGQLSDIDGY